MKLTMLLFKIRNGPTHGEVKWFKGEPVLVEVGARCHGGDGLWLALEDECFGCNQAKCAIDSYLYPNIYKSMPDAVRQHFEYLINLIMCITTFCYVLIW
jgi:hypothetical protein